MRVDWTEDEFVQLTIGPAQGAAPAPPALASSGKLEANVFAQTPYNMSTLSLTDTCYMTRTGTTCTSSGSELLVFGPDNNHTVYIRLPIKVPRNSVINVARLVLETSYSGSEFMGAAGALVDVIAKIEATANSSPLAGNPKLFDWTLPSTFTISGSLRGAVEVWFEGRVGKIFFCKRFLIRLKRTFVCSCSMQSIWRCGMRKILSPSSCLQARGSTQPIVSPTLRAAKRRAITRRPVCASSIALWLNAIVSAMLLRWRAWSRASAIRCLLPTRAGSSRLRPTKLRF